MFSFLADTYVFLLVMNAQLYSQQADVHGALQLLVSVLSTFHPPADEPILETAGGALFDLTLHRYDNFPLSLLYCPLSVSQHGCFAPCRHGHTGLG